MPILSLDEVARALLHLLPSPLISGSKQDDTELPKTHPHVVPYVEAELGLSKEWLQNHALGICSATRKLSARCPECHVLSEFDATLIRRWQQELGASPFARSKGQRRPGPHRPQVGLALLASLVDLTKLLGVSG